MAQSNEIDFSKVALLVIDVQMGFVIRVGSGDPRSTPQAEENIAKLLIVFRDKSLAIKHIHHHSKEAGSVFTPNTPGVLVQDFAKPLGKEPVYVKNVNSGFIGTNLDSDLMAQGIDTLVICGATANHCVETTTRMAGNLGFKAFYIKDAVWAYGATGPDGRTHTPDDVLSMSICNLDGEFATVVSTQEMLEKLNALS